MSAQSCYPDAALCRRCRVVAGLFFIFLLLITGVLWRSSVHFVNIRIREASRQNSQQAIEKLTTFINERLLALRQVSHFYACSEDIKQHEFVGFCDLLRADVPGIQALVITDRNGSPTWVAPADAMPMASIYRLTADPKLRQAMDRALASQQPTITETVDQPELGTGFLGAVPVIVGNRHLGFIVGIFNYQNLLSLGNMLPPELVLRYNMQITHAGWPINLPGAASFLAQDATPEDHELPLLVSQKVILGGQDWVFSVEPVNRVIASPFNFTSLTILVLGLALSVLLTWLVYRWQWQALRFQSEARDSQTRLERTGISLLELKSELDLILNSVDEGIILYNQQFEPIQANAAFLLNFGLSEECEAMRSRQAHHDHMCRLTGSKAKYWSLFETLQQSPDQSYMDELELLGPPPKAARNGVPEGEAAAKPDETASIFLRRATTASDSEGSPRGVLVIYKDVTKIKAMDRVKDEFLSNVTHELRSPLASIKGFAETLRRDPAMPPETRQEFVSIICEESSRLHDLIEELLDLRRMEAQGAPFRPTHYDLKVLTEEVVRASRTILLARQLSIKVQWSGIFDAQLKGDVGQMSRALRNLLVNAVKYSPEGSEISLYGHCGQQRVWLEISDQGSGIDEKDLPHIFEKFYRGSRQGRQKGSGLGLSIVKHIVEMHGGHLGVRSEVGRGTSFRIELPRTYTLPPSAAGDGRPGEVVTAQEDPAPASPAPASRG